MIHGGKVIGAGGFGCVFYPALTCNSTPRNSTQISKLMPTKYTDEEFEYIQTFNTVLKTIPNYQKYYLLYDVTKCIPDKLTSSDLENYNKCESLIDENITSKNINKSLNKLEVLNMPFGGIPIDNYVKSSQLNIDKLKILNNSLINLLDGIILMNNKKVYHCDVKDSNILIDGNNISRLIDWGLSNIYDNKIIYKLSRRPFQFNMPYSVILFNSNFQKNYYEFLFINLHPTFLSIKLFVSQYIKNLIKENGIGHIGVINEINQILYRETNETDMFNHTLGNISTYITNILVEFTKNNTFNLQKYMDEVFLKNVDIWGFVITYISIIEEISSLKNITSEQINIINNIKILIESLLEYSSKPIDITKLKQMLKELFIFNNKSKGKKMKNKIKSVLLKNTSSNIHKSNLKVNYKKSVKLNISKLLSNHKKSNHKNHKKSKKNK